MKSKGWIALIATIVQSNLTDEVKLKAIGDITSMLKNAEYGGEVEAEPLDSEQSFDGLFVWEASKLGTGFWLALVNDIGVAV